MATFSPIERHLQDIYEQCLLNRAGAVADYIPELRAVDPDKFGICLATADGHVYEYGDTTQPFTIQSISKPLTYALALMDHGEGLVDSMIGIEPSGEAFNEISLDPTTKRPRNPMINAGAITAASLVGGAGAEERFARIHDFYSRAAGTSLGFNERVFRSESETGHRNRAIAHMLRSVDAITGDADAALDLYFRQCSIEVTCRDLSVIAATLANSGTHPTSGDALIDSRSLRRVLSVMATCGMYDAAGDWLTTVGMPAKSGVGGGILAVLPGQLGIGIYSPRLDTHGHTERGMQACRMLSELFELHFLAVPRSARNTLRSVTSHEYGKLTAGVYELQGDLLFAGVESVLRQTRGSGPVHDIVVLDVSRVDQVSQVARTILREFAQGVRGDGREVILVDPDRLFAPTDGSHPDDLLSFDDRDSALTWVENTAHAAGRPLG